MEYFQTPLFLRSAHLQTLLPWFLRKKLLINYQKECLELPDGDFLNLFFTKPYQNRILILALAGLEGSHNSSYLKGLSAFFANKKNYSLVIMNHRGCGYECNRFLPSYHAGTTKDLDFVVKQLQSKVRKIFVLGFSLGGNMVLKWLGENPNQTIVKAAVAVSVPFKLNETGEYTKKKTIYHNYLLGLLKSSLLKKMQKFTIPNGEKLSQVKTIFDFDSYYTAPIHGFSGVQDYYLQSSCYSYLKKIKTLTLMLQAKDDPLIPKTALPRSSDIAKNTCFQLSEQGGHVGFIYWKNLFHLSQPRKAFCFWLEQKIFSFIKQFCNEK